MIVKKSEAYADFENCPEGSYQAVLCEVVDLGMVESEYMGKKKNLHKCLFVYQVAVKDEEGNEVRRADGCRFEVSKRMTVSLFDQAEMFKWIQAWRGKKFTADESLELQVNGFDLDKLLGVNGLVQVMHAPSKDGTKTYVNAAGIQPWQQTWGAKIAPENYQPRAPRIAAKQAAQTGETIPKGAAAKVLGAASGVSFGSKGEVVTPEDDKIPF